MFFNLSSEIALNSNSITFIGVIVCKYILSKNYHFFSKSLLVYLASFCIRHFFFAGCFNFDREEKPGVVC